MEINRNLISGVAFLAMAVAVTIFISLPENGARRLSFRERRVIARSDTVMRVLDIGLADPEAAELGFRGFGPEVGGFRETGDKDGQDRAGPEV